VASQAISSAGNLLSSAAAARYLGVSSFAAFAAASISAILAVGVFRAVVVESLLSTRAESSEEVEASVSRASVGIAACFSLVFGLGGLVLATPYGEVFWVLALVLPAAIVLDARRHVFFWQGTPQRSVVEDLRWLALNALGIAGLIATGTVSAPSVLAVWGMTALPGAIALVRHTGVAKPSFVWLRSNRPLPAHFLGEWIISAGLLQVLVLALGALAGSAALAGFRGAQVLFGPLGIAFGGLTAALVPIRSGDVGTKRASPGGLVGLSVGLFALGIGATLVTLMSFDRVGAQLFGLSAGNVEELIGPVGVLSASGGASVGAFIGLRALRASRAIVQLRLALALPMIAAAIAGATIGGPPGFGWALAAHNFATSIGLWWVYRRSLESVVPEPALDS
jgi:hypothetical protein